MYSGWLLFYLWIIIQVPLLVGFILPPRELHWVVSFLPTILGLIRIGYVAFRIWLTCNVRFNKSGNDN